MLVARVGAGGAGAGLALAGVVELGDVADAGEDLGYGKAGLGINKILAVGQAGLVKLPLGEVDETVVDEPGQLVALAGLLGHLAQNCLDDLGAVGAADDAGGSEGDVDDGAVLGAGHLVIGEDQPHRALVGEAAGQLVPHGGRNLGPGENLDSLVGVDHVDHGAGKGVGPDLGVVLGEGAV